MVFWKDKQNWQTSSQAHQEEKREDPNKLRNERGEITCDTHFREADELRGLNKISYKKSDRRDDKNIKCLFKGKKCKRICNN